jgi:hypothetical protein
VLHSWRDACNAWCYAREEEGKFGDQKYLDEWPTRFRNAVHVLRHLGGGIAPWNMQQYDFRESGTCVRAHVIGATAQFDVVFFHFHALRHMTRDMIYLGNYRLSESVLTLLYRPYLLALERIGAQIRGLGISVHPHGEPLTGPRWHHPLWLRLAHEFNGRVPKRNVRPLQSILSHGQAH